MWACLGGDRAAKFEQAEHLPPPGIDAPGGEAYEFLRGMARAPPDPRAWRLDHRAGAGRRCSTPPWCSTRTGREMARYRKMHLFDIVTPDGQGYRESATYGAGGRDRDLRGRRGEARLRHLLRSALSGAVPGAAPGRGRADLPARRRSPCDRQGPLGDADPRPGDRDAVLVRRTRHLGRHLEGSRRACGSPTGTRWCEPLGACGGAGVRRYRLGDGADRSGADRAGAPRHAGAGPPEAAL